MQVSFKSLDDDGNEIDFRSDALYKDDYLIFNDNQYDDTTIYLKASNNRIELLRKGQINMSLIFDNDKIGFLKYENEGLYFELSVEAKEIIIKKEHIYFEYNLYDDINYVGNHKIWIKLH